MLTATFIIPGPIGTLTGGFLYDKRIVEGLKAQGATVDTVELPEGFPEPGPEARRRAARVLESLPKGSLTVIDGLAFAALPDLALRHRDRLTLIALVHHPLAEETGLDGKQRERFQKQERQALSAAHGIIVTSPHTAGTLLDYGAAPERIRVAVPGVDAAPLARGSGGGTPAILSVGTVTPRKGHLELIQALARLKHLEWQLTCIGSTTRDPETAGQLRDLIQSLNLTARVRLLGELEPDALAAHYHDSDLFVLASHHEGYGMALGEALARGLPIVSTTAGAIPDTVPATAGILVPPGDPSALAKALDDVIAHPARRRSLAEGARRARQALTGWPEATSRFAKALLELSAA